MTFIELMFTVPKLPLPFMLFLGVYLLCSGSVSAQELPQDALADPIKGLNQQLSLSIGKASLSEIVQVLGEQQKANIITDSYGRDLLYRPGWNIEGVPLTDFEQTVSEVFGRELKRAGSIAVLRSIKPSYELSFDASARENEALETIDFLLLLDASGTPLPARVGGDATFGPTSEIVIRASDVPLETLLSRLKQQSEWQVQLPVRFAERRVNAFLRCNIGEFSAALAALIGADVQVVIEQSAQQKAQIVEAEWLSADMQLTRQIERYSSSDELKKRLYPLLSREQVATMKQEGYAEFPVSALPLALQKEALQYIEVSRQFAKRAGVPVVISDDTSRFTLELSTMPSNAIIISGFDVSGNSIRF